MSGQVTTTATPMRGVLSLSLGTAVTRGLALCTQLLLVIWLAPAEFGYWAAASSAMSLVTGLVNFGEVSGYLANEGSMLKRARRAIWRLNTLLIIVGLGIAGAYLYSGETRVAALALLIAVSIPIQGDSDLMYAAGVRSGQFSLLIWSQSFGAVLKLVVAVAIALWSESALALAVSALAYYVALDTAILSRLRRNDPQPATPVYEPHRKQRFSWAVNSLMMTIPLQSAYLVTQFLAAPEVLGILYLAFQITLGISGVISQPLARVALSAFASLQGGDRAQTAMSFMNVFASGMLIIVACGILVLPWAEPYISPEWAVAIPATLTLLVSLTPRIVSPVIDGFQQSSGRWWQATSFNAVDAIGTGLAACTAVFGDVVLLAMSISVWKVLFGVSRFLIVMREVELASRALFAGLLLLTSALGFVSVTSEYISRSILGGLLIVFGAGWLLLALRRTTSPVAAKNDKVD
ncbi:oligosaccharide flippase family protein [Kocuria rosea]|uniref:oligosaccharide flippase family protein n=1 Tax=Kocuria rosea TaxID=1275 RepID=UPI002B24199F|nr:oligosaccharide flippase family protein [Kocuria rosea]MEB2526487.1 oligosaccharide flippase family protein [Kocuria rosea]MEB2619240.1 oligosaccharide flippase family protein [Kocuria rosea]